MIPSCHVCIDSVVHEQSVIHYQIRRRGEDALFSLSVEQKVIHGLDQLVTFYQRNKHSGLQHPLLDYVQGNLPPPEARYTWANPSVLFRAVDPDPHGSAFILPPGGGVNFEEKKCKVGN